MKKGIFSGIIILLALFLVSSTIIYSRIPILETHTAVETEAMKNVVLNSQKAREFADEAFAETIYDEGLVVIDFDDANPSFCDGIYDKPQIEDRFQQYLLASKAEFGPCRILKTDSSDDPPEIDLPPGPPLGEVIGGPGAPTYNFKTSVKIKCEAPRDLPLKKIVYEKDFTFYKLIELVEIGTDCWIRVKDYDAQYYWDVPLP